MSKSVEEMTNEELVQEVLPLELSDAVEMWKYRTELLRRLNAEEPVKPRCPECGETEFFIHQQPMTGVEVTCMQVTSRHKQILKLLLAGKINKEIAAELNLSEHVVKNEIRAIFKHFGIHRRCEIFPILETVRKSL